MPHTLVINTTNPITIQDVIFLGSDGSPLSVTGTTSGTFTPTSNKVTLSYTLVGEPHMLRIIMSTSPSFTVNFYGGTFSIFNQPNQVTYVNGNFVHYFRLGNDGVAYSDVASVSSFKRSSFWTTAVYTSGSVEENSTIRFKFVDSLGNSWVNWRTVGGAAYQNTVQGAYTSFNLDKSMIKLRERSSLANLYAQQAPVITAIDVYEYNAQMDRVVVRADKIAQVVIYVMNLDTNQIELSSLAFARDNTPYAKEHTYYIPKVTGNKKIVAIPTLDSYAKDFNGTAALNALSTYNYSTSELIVSRYQEGYDKGRKDAYQEIYALGATYGYGFNFNERTDYGTTAENNLFISTIADHQYAKGIKELYDRGATYGYTYNTSTLDRTYLFNQQVPFINKVTSSGAVEAYRALYDRGLPYGFTYDNTQLDKSYYQSKETEFITKLDTLSTAKGYKTAYSELFTAGRTYEGVAGLPLGGNLWVDDTGTNPNFATKKDEFIRHVYNTGYVRAKQETFDRGLPYGFDFRNFVNTNKAIADQTILADYYNIGDDFVNTVTSQSRVTTYNEIYGYVDQQYGFVWDSTNTTSMTSTDYLAYLSGLKPAMITRINEASRIAAYKEVFAQSSNDYLFTFNSNSTVPSYYQGIIDASYRAAYNYGARAAYQDIYDQGAVYNFNNLTQYGTYKNVSYTLKPTKNDATTDYFHSVSETYTNAVRDYGSVFTYKSFFSLAGEYGFTYDNTQTALTYYAAKRTEFLDIYSAGNYSEGIRFIFDSAATRYGFTYTFSPNKAAMEAQVPGLFTFQENGLKAEAYRYVLEAMANQTFYNIPFNDSEVSETLKSQIVPNITKVKDSAGREAYNYVFVTANTRVGFTPPASSLSAATLKTSVIPMFTYVENYKEADAYRRVHNYAKNFLNIGYTFTDSTDPRVLENQVPALFNYLEKNGGYSAYRYVHDTAVNKFGWSYTDGGTSDNLKAQIVPMFEFINTSFVDIKHISEPKFEWPNRIVFEVELNRAAGVYAILVDKETSEHIAGFSSMIPSTEHQVKFGVGMEIFKKPVGIVIIPTPRNMTT